MDDFSEALKNIQENFRSEAQIALNKMEPTIISGLGAKYLGTKEQDGKLVIQLKGAIPKELQQQVDAVEGLEIASVFERSNQTQMLR